MQVQHSFWLKYLLIYQSVKNFLFLPQIHTNVRFPNMKKTIYVKSKIKLNVATSSQILVDPKK